MNTDKRKLVFGIAILMLIKLAIHFFSNGSYGFHRDELLHLAVGEHLDWGFMEFPPMIGLMAEIQRGLFGDTVMAIRVFPALIGAGLIFLAAWMARILGGGFIASMVAGLCVLGSLAYFRNHTLFQPVVFDQLFWALGYLMLLKYLKGNQNRHLYLLGVIAGLGLLMKYTMFFWGFGIAVALLFHERGRVYRTKTIWIAAGIAFLLILPNILWQYQYNFPVLAHFTGLYEVQLEEVSRLDFVTIQLLAMNPLNVPIWLGGLIYFLGTKELRKYRPLAIAFLVSGLTLCLAKGKGYYFFAAYPIAFAAGGIMVEKLIQKRWLIWMWAVSLLVITASQLPFMLPILPINDFVQYADLQQNNAARYDDLTSDYADMFGWEEQVALVDSVYRSLSDEERKVCILWAENYGEAGAIKIIGDEYNLPNPVCKHGSFWLWGAGTTEGEIAVSIGNEEEAVSYFYEEYTLIKMIKHPYAIDEEHQIPLYLCRKPRVKLKEYWPNYESRIFE